MYQYYLIIASITAIIIWAFLPFIPQHILARFKPSMSKAKKGATYIQKGDAEEQISYLQRKRAMRAARMNKDKDAWAFLEDTGRKVEQFTPEEIEQVYQLGADLQSQGMRYEHQS